MIKYILLGISIVVGSCGQIMIKIGVNQSKFSIPSIHSTADLINAIFIFLKNFWILSAMGLYGTAVLLWFFILSKFELSYVFPIVTAATFIFVLFLSRAIINENINILRIIGTFIIIIGILIVAKS